MKQTIATAGIAAVVLALQMPLRAAGPQTLSGHVPEAISRLSPVDHLPAARNLDLSVGLRLRNLDSLTNLLRQIYNPGGAQFHRYLTPAQFTERFGPTDEDYRAVISFMQTNGFAISHEHSNRLLLNVSGTVANIERTFHTHLLVYRHPSEPRNFYAPDVEPAVDLGIPLSRLGGLDNFSPPHPADLKPFSARLAATAIHQGGSGPGGTYVSKDFRQAYASGVALSGAGQSIGLVEFDGFYTNDIETYENSNGLSAVTLTNVLLDNFNGAPGSDNGEVALDIELAIAMAPGLSSVIVYEAGPQGSPDDILNRMATDDLSSQLSSSWLWGGGDDLLADQIFMEFAAQGQSFFNSSGDEGAYSGSVTFPADNPYITIVGGTTLTTGQNGSWQSEVVWDQSYGRSGGGVSLTYAIPSWQQGISMTVNEGSTNYRNIPDVALVADNVWAVYNNGAESGYHGTSCSAPLWAGFTALVNQQGAVYGQPPTGFLNPALSAIGLGTNYAACFHDITTGNNTNDGSPMRFFAVPGYDLCTGWGSPGGQALINALEPQSYLVVSPQISLAAYGLPGGPFNPPTLDFDVSNAGPSSLSWSVTSSTPWLSVAPTNGVLNTASPAASVIVSLNSNASTLSAGIYTTTVSFSDESNGIARAREVTLQVSQSLVRNGNFATGNFSDWTLIGSTQDNEVSSSIIVPHSGNYAAVFGQVGSLAYLSQSLSTVPGQAYLLSFWLANPSGDTPNEFLLDWKTNSSSTNTLLNQTNLDAFNWTNEQFIVVASGTNSQLQFGFMDGPQFLGLDNVNLIPIPGPEFQAPAQTNNTIILSWTSFPGLTYRVQYKSNLAQIGWNNLSNSVTASNGITSAFDSLGPDPQRFYRVIALP